MTHQRSEVFRRPRQGDAVGDSIHVHTLDATMVVEAILLLVLSERFLEIEAFATGMKGAAVIRVRKAEVPFYAGLIFSDGLGI